MKWEGEALNWERERGCLVDEEFWWFFLTDWIEIMGLIEEMQEMVEINVYGFFLSNETWVGPLYICSSLMLENWDRDFFS